MSRPRIAFDARMWHHTGIGRYIQNLIPRLHGIDLIIYVAPGDVALLQEIYPEVSVRPCPAKLFSVQELLFWHRELRLQPLALFHSPHINVPASGSVPQVVTVHDLIPLRFPGTINSWLGRLYFSIMAQVAVDRAKRVIAVSENTKRDVMALLGTPAERIRVIGEAADPRFAEPVAPEHLAAVRERYGLTGDYLLYTGQWKPYKNLDTLIRAFAQLREKHPALKLALVGREDETQPHVPALIAELGLEGAVVRTGYLADEQDLIALYQGASVFAFPSRYEGFGLPPLEAMAAGVPVVSSDAASLPEVVGEAGLLVPPEDVNGWVHALDLALTDQDLRAKLVKAGRARAAACSWDQVAEATLRVYDEVLRSAP